MNPPKMIVERHVKEITLYFNSIDEASTNRQFFLASTATFGGALVGITYGVLSASWEPGREGRILVCFLFFSSISSFRRPSFLILIFFLSRKFLGHHRVQG